MRRHWYYLQAILGEYGWRVQAHLITRDVYPIVTRRLR